MTDPQPKDGKPPEQGGPKDEANRPEGSAPKVDGLPLGEAEVQRVTLPPEMPVLPVRGLVLFPQVVLPIAVNEERDLRLVNDVVVGNHLMVVVAVKNEKAEHPGPDDLYQVGCAVAVLKMMKFPDETTRILVQGLSRVRLDQITSASPYLKANVSRLESVLDDNIQTRALARSVVEQFQKLVDLSPHLPDELKLAILNIDDVSRLADVVSTTLNLSVAQRQESLETVNVAERLRKVNVHLSRELQTAELSTKITSQVKTEFDKDQREFILRRQLKAIQEELGETDEGAAEWDELRKRIQKLRLPEEAKKEAQRELDRLKKMPPQASEYHVARTYLDWIISLPWHKSTTDRLDIARAEAILNEDHYDLDRVKQRILEYLAVRKLKKDTRGPILCFVGPPGTGKTSLGRSIARALGRKFVRISLGGVRDEAEIRGHRRTYVGALPGRIIQGIRKAESNNPVFMLDEIDKLGMDFRGDPSAALLEVLDPEQNFSFSDHYLDVPFDLSHVMFITTANVLDTVPPPLRDRMEVLELPGYTLEEKIAIANKYLIPRQKEQNGLKKGDLKFSDPIISLLIANYTREAGLRNLEREIASLCRKQAAVIAREKRRKKQGRTLTEKDVATWLGPPKHIPEIAERSAEPGIATGLAWTPEGGDILFIESTCYPGNGKLSLTGQLGDVMKESAQAALSFIRARSRKLRIEDKQFSAFDVHIHVPAGAIPKDGPSAGVTLAMSMISLFTGRPVKPDVAMTGEITLRGRVLPVGGIKEKVLAAHRAGIHTIVLPKQNEKDLADVPAAARKGMKFVFVQTVDEMLPVVFSESQVPARSRPRCALPTRRHKSR
ncbi:MAG: endopeptidase La [Candidatus Brocadiia bacterium]